MADTNNIYTGGKASNTTRWLLLIAAILIVVVLLTMLISGKFRKSTTAQITDAPVELMLEPTPDSDIDDDIMASAKVNWGTTIVGETKNADIKIYANASTNIKVDVSRDDVAGFNQTTTCNSLKKVDAAIPCSVKISFTPLEEMSQTNVAINVRWWTDKEKEEMAHARAIRVVLGAKLPEKQEPTPSPVQPVAPTPFIDVPEPQEPTQSTNNFDNMFAKPVEKSVMDIAPSDPFQDMAPKTPAFFPEQSAVSAKQESCSEFAFPGYDTYGTQIGWIKPERGAYYFHPFSDRDCTNPTGVYNPDNGIITDVNNSGRRIGTDAEHIGYIAIGDGIPQLSNANDKKSGGRARQLTDEELATISKSNNKAGRLLGEDTGFNGIRKKENPDVIIGTSGDAVLSTEPYDRTFVLRQYKPIPATIVSDVRADIKTLKNTPLPVRATVDRNVYSDNGRTVVIPAGTLLLGYISDDELPGPYKSIGRMGISWYQFILPSGAEFNFEGDKDTDPFSGDAQGRVGVPGHGSTDYVEQIVMPMLTAIVPAAVNMIAPIADTFVNKIDLDNNTVTQSGTVRSSELAKNQIVNAWNQVAQKLLVDAMDNTVPPFTIAAGTRITVYSPNDLIITCGNDDTKKCSVSKFKHEKGGTAEQKYKRATPTSNRDRKWSYESGTDIGQVRSFMINDYCDDNGGVKATAREIEDDGYDYRTILFYCQSQQYQAINNAKQDALYQNQQDVNNKKSVASTGGKGTQKYNEQVLELKYTSEGDIKNPFKSEPAPVAAPTITCLDGTNPDANGCCTGEIYTDMGEMGFNCCPETGGDCFPPITQ